MFSLIKKVLNIRRLSNLHLFRDCQKINPVKRTIKVIQLIEEDSHFISFLATLNNEDNENSKPEFKMEYSYQIKDGKHCAPIRLEKYYY